MSETPDLSTLPQRMRYAATIIEEARTRYHGNPENDNSPWIALTWNKGDLHTFAAKWEAQDREAAEREEMVEELAAHLYNTLREESYREWPPADKVERSDFRRLATRLIESGWTKEDPA